METASTGKRVFFSTWNGPKSSGKAEQFKDSGRRYAGQSSHFVKEPVERQLIHSPDISSDTAKSVTEPTGLNTSPQKTGIGYSTDTATALKLNWRAFGNGTKVKTDL